MRFGGHETFAIREGWLSKGLRIVADNPEKFNDEHIADWLGVGRNMAKSIRHWLLATGLAEPETGMQPGKRTPLRPTHLGEIVLKHDRHFADIGTWWVLHTNLITNKLHAFSWDWLFNQFSLTRFDKAVCLESLNRLLQMQKGRLPSPKTLDRDLSCLLQSYARSIPDETSDPEDARDCPFRELGLLTHYRVTGYYQVDQSTKVVSNQVFFYMLTRAFGDESTGDTLDVALPDAAHRRGSPGRALCLTAEGLYELAVHLESQNTGLQIGGLAGERRLQIERRPADDWLEEYYTESGMVDRHAA